jgi:hemoglobin-like flavoprotein
MGLYLSCACNSVFAAPDDRRPHKLTRAQVAIVNKYLPSFPYYTTSTAAHRMTAAGFWNEAFFEVGPPSGKSTNSGKRSNTSSSSTRITQLYDTFYSYLDHNSPALKPIFRSSLVVRGKVLVHISAGLRSILVGANMVERVESLTQTHLRFGVKMEHYDPLGVALIFAMKECSGALWSPQIEEAWRRIYAHCCVVLLDAHRRTMDQHGAKTRDLAKAGASPNVNDLHTNLRPPSIKENSIAPASSTSANSTRGVESAT